jgi:hypothetical protein
VEQWSKPNNLCIRTKGSCAPLAHWDQSLIKSGTSFDDFSMNVFIGSGDNYAFVTIMTLPNEWLSLFDPEKFFKA